MSKVQLMLGDCLERMKEIPDGSISMILADPPYGTTACKWDSIIDLDLMWEQLKRIIKPDGAIVMTASQPFTSVLVCSNLKMFKYCWVWEKSKATGHLNSKKRPMAAHEDIVVFYKKQVRYRPQMTQGEPYNKGTAIRDCEIFGGGKQKETTVKSQNGLRYPRSVQRFRTAESEGKHHPTQKPVALMEYLIKTYTNEGETVLDFACGSGTTGVAAKNLNRDFIGIEMDEGYFKIAQERIANA